MNWIILCVLVYYLVSFVNIFTDYQKSNTNIFFSFIVLVIILFHHPLSYFYLHIDNLSPIGMLLNSLLMKWYLTPPNLLMLYLLWSIMFLYNLVLITKTPTNWLCRDINLLALYIAICLKFPILLILIPGVFFFSVLLKYS